MTNMTALIEKLEKADKGSDELDAKGNFVEVA